MAAISEAIEPSELLDWEHMEEERTSSENDTHWKLRRAFLQRFRDDFPRDRLRSLSMIFCNVTFLNCSYSPAMMKRVAEFNAALQNDIKIAKGFKLARKTFSLPSLDSDEDETPVFDVDSVLCTAKDDDVLPAVSSSTTSTGPAVPAHLLDGLNALGLSPRSGGLRASPTLGPGVFHISVIEGAEDAKPVGSKNKNKKKRFDVDDKPKRTNGAVNTGSMASAIGVSAATKPSAKKRNKNRVGKSTSIETTTTEDFLRSLVNNKADQKKKKDKEKKHSGKAGGGDPPSKTDCKTTDNKPNTIAELSG